jgi:hypothetical protein
MRKVSPKLRNSLFFSLLAGNLDAETGSTTTASATTHSLASLGFPVSVESGRFRAECVDMALSGLGLWQRSRLPATLFLLDIEGLNFTSIPYPPAPICVIAPPPGKGAHMLDLGLLVSGLSFFALSIGYALVCDRL